MSNCKPGDRVCAALNYIKNLKFCTYCRKKTYSQLSVDVALIVVNAAHMTHIIKAGDRDALYIVKLCLVSLSIFLEVCIGILLALKEKYDINEETQHRFMNRLNNFLVWLIFFSVLVHVFVTVFVEQQYIPPLRGQYRNCSAT